MRVHRFFPMLVVVLVAQGCRADDDGAMPFATAGPGADTGASSDSSSDEDAGVDEGASAEAGDDSGPDLGPDGGSCGNGVVDGTEECDGDEFEWRSCLSFGFEAGTLDCTVECAVDTAGCLAEAVCGDGVVSGVEDCDGGVDGESCVGLELGEGAIACGADCRWDATDCACKGAGETCWIDWNNPGAQSDCCPAGFKGVVHGACGAGSGKCS